MDFIPVNNTASAYQTNIEVFLSIIPITFLMTMSSIAATIIHNISKNSFIFSHKTKIIFLIENLLITIPMILYYMPIRYENLFTVYSFAFNALIGFGTYLIYIITQLQKLYPCKETKNTLSLKRKYYITNFRSSVNFLTVIVILAVDFKIFPTACTKTENYGYSLMDVGVGLFVVSNGIVAPEIHKSKETFRKSLIGSGALLTLGLFRFALTKVFNYPFNENEYGAHWNFFMTLAFTKILSSFILNYSPLKKPLIVSMIILVSYETLLYNGYSNWILANYPRDNFVSSNREGIFSTIGYVGLYFLSVFIGKLLNKPKASRKFLIFILTTISVLFYSMTYYFEQYFGVSRRLANAGYCTWIICISTIIILILLFMEVLLNYLYKFKTDDDDDGNKVYSPLIIDAVNYNGLPFFLVANLLTGSVNLALKTGEIENERAVFVVFIYMLINCMFVTVLYVKRIKIKQGL